MFRKKKPSTTTDLERFSLDHLVQAMKYAGQWYQPTQETYTAWGRGESLPSSFPGYAAAAATNGVLFAVVAVRMMVLSEARFAFRRYVGGRLSDYHGDTSLGILETPWPGGTTGELISRLEFDASLCGNSYWVRAEDRLVRLRPDRVTIVTDSDDPDADVLGYAYTPGENPGTPARLYFPEEVAHYSPIPDPMARFRGMTWMTPILREIRADNDATDVKAGFFRHGMTPNVILKNPGELNEKQIAQLRDQFDRGHAGVENAYKALVLQGGMDLTVAGSNLEQADLRAVQGAGETRIAAAGGTPPVIVGLSEGLQAATYSNYGQARRRFADGTLRPLWRMMASSLGALVPPPAGSALVVDDRDIAFLREDSKDAADIQSTDAQTIKQLVEAGFKPEDVVNAVMAGDLRRIAKSHTGATSVQLQTPAEGAAA